MFNTQPIIDLAKQIKPLLFNGGPVLWLLLALALVAAVVIVCKWVQFAYLGVNRSGYIKRALFHWRKGNFMPAVKTLGDQHKRPAAQVLEAAMSGLINQQPIQAVKDEVTRQGKQQVEHLRSWLKLLESIATISPLIGLLGTVQGMITAFMHFEQTGGTVEPALLSGSIWQALLTTAVGIMIAIPSLLAHQWFERRIERSAHTMQDAASHVFTSGPKSATDWRAE